MGEFLRRKNYSITEAFEILDDDRSKTISRQDLQQALLGNRFQLDMNERHLKAFLDKVFTDKQDNQKKSYIT